MTNTVEPTVEWSQDQMVEVVLNEPDDFLKVRETLDTYRSSVKEREETLSVLPYPAQAVEDISSSTLRNCLLWMVNMLI